MVARSVRCAPVDRVAPCRRAVGTGRSIFATICSIGKNAHTRRGELDREGNPFELSAQPPEHRNAMWRYLERSISELDSIDEKLYRLTVEKRLH